MTPVFLLDINAVVLAGTRSSGDMLCQSEGVTTKAIIDIAGRPMLNYVLDALVQAGVSSRVCLLGPDSPELRQAAGDVDVRFIEPQGKGPASSLLAALESGHLTTPLLVTTCDHPLLTSEMIQHFVTQAQAIGAELAIGLAERAEIEKVHPETKRTYLKLGGHELSGCNLFYLSGPNALDALRFWEQVEHLRKKPLAIARHFGITTMLRLLLTRNRPGAAWDLLSRRLKVHVHPVLMPFGNAAIDVDKPEDLLLVRKFMEPEAQ